MKWDKETLILICEKINSGTLDINEVIKAMNIESQEELDFYEEKYKIIHGENIC